MARSNPRVPDVELKILQILWDRGSATARETTDAIYGVSGASQVATVQKLLQRLEAKGLVDRDRSGHVHAFKATMTQAAFVGGQFEQLAQRLTEGSLVPFLTHMMQTQKLTTKERAELRRLLDATDRQKPRGRE